MADETKNNVVEFPGEPKPEPENPEVVKKTPKRTTKPKPAAETPAAAKASPAPKKAAAPKAKPEPSGEPEDAPKAPDEAAVKAAPKRAAKPKAKPDAASAPKEEPKDAGEVKATPKKPAKPKAKPEAPIEPTEEPKVTGEAKAAPKRTTKPKPKPEAPSVPEEKAQSLGEVDEVPKTTAKPTEEPDTSDKPKEAPKRAAAAKKAPKAAAKPEESPASPDAVEKAPESPAEPAAEPDSAEAKLDGAEAVSPEKDTVGSNIANTGAVHIYKAGGRTEQLPPRPPKPPKPPKSAEQMAWEQARKDHFKTKYWEPLLRPIVALVAICLVASLLLGVTNYVTAPIISAEEERVAQETRIALLPEADSFAPVEGELPEGITAIYQATNGAGYIIESYGRGYGGKVPATVAFNANGTIVGVVFTSNDETVGLGQKVTQASFSNQFTNRPAQAMSLSDIDAITSATVSSNAALTAVNTAIEAYNELTGGATLPQTPEEVNAALLPGETLAAITLDSPGVQPTAYRSDAGNYIIYGQRPEEDDASKVVVAAVAMDGEGVILNLWLDTSGENYGASLATDTAFINSFIGLSAPVEVDAVAGVTGSSDKVMEAANNALAALPAAKEAA